jgi:hypothetical protein
MTPSNFRGVNFEKTNYASAPVLGTGSRRDQCIQHQTDRTSRYPALT